MGDAKITANHHVLAVHSLDDSARFFEQLGFRQVHDDGGWRFMKRDNCMVMLGLCTDATAPRDLGDHQYFGYLVVDDVDAFHAEVTARGAAPHGPPVTKPWGMRETGFTTPEGHRLLVGQNISRPVDP